MSTRIVQIDAFTERPFSGNPAGVCLLVGETDRKWMQLVAREMNLSETAFLRRVGTDWDLRWFTPKVEVDLCGHATLAAAHFLWEEGLLDDGEPARFRTRSGLLTAHRLDDEIELDFPADPPVAASPPEELARALGARPTWVGKGRFDWLFRLASETVVRGLAPDLGTIERWAARGVIVTAGAVEPGTDFVSRFFAPAAGVPEDPVTGSAHCTLGPYWTGELGRGTLSARQVSDRGGRLRVTTAGDRVRLAGTAVRIMEVELAVDPGSYEL